MIGSPAIAAFIALWGFWILQTLGWVRGELGVRTSVAFLMLWLAGFVGFRYVPFPYGGLFSSYVAMLDVALVFAIFKGNVRV